MPMPRVNRQFRIRSDLCRRSDKLLVTAVFILPLSYEVPPYNDQEVGHLAAIQRLEGSAYNNGLPF